MGTRLAAVVLGLVGLAACGDDSSTTHDAAISDGHAADTGVDATCTVASSTDHPTFWPTLCATADTCGWLTGGHPELENDEASCNTRHASDPDIATLLDYMADFEVRVHAAAACLGCQALLDAYFRPDLETVFCAQYARCVTTTTENECRTQYEADVMRPGSQAKFDYACPRYCIEQLAVDAPCTDVITCLQACN